MGRNLWSYQQVEAQLRALLSISSGAVRRGEDGSLDIRRGQGRPARTLGELAGAAFADVFEESARGPENAEDCLTWVLRVEAESQFSAGLRQQISTLVNERNRLVHHALGRWDLDDEASLDSAMATLDSERERIVQVYESLRHLLLAARDAIEAMSNYLGSPEFAESLRHAKLTTAICDAVGRAARADGWTPLAHAGHLFQAYLKSLPPAARESLPRLSRMLADSGAFEIREEPTAAGGTRTMCRLRATTAD